MSHPLRRFAVTIWKSLLIFVALVSLGCRAQQPTAELTRTIEKQVRSTFKVPAQVNIQVGPRKSSGDFAGYDSVSITFVNGERTQTHDFLISKDNKALVSVMKMDLTKDPYADVMSKIDTTGRPWRGAKDAKVTVVVYDDFQCPFCSRMHTTLFDNVMKQYGDRVKVIYKDYPLFEIHPWAGRAAINSNCLAKQSTGAYWELADYVHANGKSIQGEKRPVELQFAELDRVTLDTGKKHNVDGPKLEACVKAQTSTDLEASVKEAESLGVNATPALFINGVKLDGAVPAPELMSVLDSALKDAGVQPPVKAATAPTGSK